MLQYYLKMQPQLFESAVEQQLQRMKEEKDEKDAQSSQEEADEASGEKPPPSSSELVLRKRMEEVRASEVRATLEDLMYLSILEKFVVLGVEMLPRMDGFVEPGPANLIALTDGIHSKEALELVREHLLGVMGAAASNKFSNELIKMSKFQMAQVYAASIMFGYFLRRVDKRFQLDKALGTLVEDPEPDEDAVLRLERLFAQAEDMASTQDPDTAPTTDSSGSSSGSSKGGEVVDLDLDTVSSSSSRSSSSSGGETSISGRSASEEGRSLKRQKSALRSYVESFDQATMVDTARVVSTEGGALVERQTTALFGDIQLLTKQMQEALGEGITSAEELYGRIQEAVATNKISTLTMTIATQRRSVLEAVAFGSFLRDVEGYVQTEYGLLTPLPPPKLPPGAGAL